MGGGGLDPWTKAAPPLTAAGQRVAGRGLVLLELEKASAGVRRPRWGWSWPIRADRLGTRLTHGQEAGGAFTALPAASGGRGTVFVGKDGHGVGQKAEPVMEGLGLEAYSRLGVERRAVADLDAELVRRLVEVLADGGASRDQVFDGAVLPCESTAREERGPWPAARRRREELHLDSVDAAVVNVVADLEDATTQRRLIDVCRLEGAGGAGEEQGDTKTGFHAGQLLLECGPPEWGSAMRHENNGVCLDPTLLKVHRGCGSGTNAYHLR